VSDGIIAKFHGAPRPVQTNQRSGNRVKARWTIRKAIDENRQIANFLNYDLTFNTSTGSAKMFVRPANFSTVFHGSGTCSLRA